MASAICPRCLLRTTLRTGRTQHSQLPPRRSFNASSTIANAASKKSPIPSDVASTSTTPSTPPRATSTSAAQPFSAASTPSADKSAIPTTPSDPVAGLAASKQDKQASHRAAPAIVSSVPAGTKLLGLNYFKGKEDPVAMADEEYPAWLWTVLGAPKKSELLGGAGKEEQDPRLYSKSAKARRMANKRLRAKTAAETEFAQHKVPVFEQSVDLPATADAGDTARHELQRAMRQKRKGDIKTANFLKGIR